MLETIEATIREYNKDRNSSSSNDSTDSKKRRQSTDVPNGNSEVDNDFTESHTRSKKRFVKKQNKDSERVDYTEPSYSELYEDIDFDDELFVKVNGPDLNVGCNGGRVLPSWSTTGN